MIANQFVKLHLRLKYIVSVRCYARQFGRKDTSKMTSSDASEMSEIFADELDDPRTNATINPSDFKDVAHSERDKIKKAIIHKKAAKKPPVFSVLTPRAMEQMFHLFHEDNLTAEDLSEKFPISLNYCSTILQSDLKPLSLPQLIQQNEVIINRLFLLRALCKKRTLDKYHEFQWIIEEDKSSLLKYANGNYTLAFPEKSMLQLQTELEANRIAGPMESLYNLTTLCRNNIHLPLTRGPVSVLDKQNQIIESIIAYFKPASETIEENERRLQLPERPQLKLPNKASVDYTAMFRYRIDSKRVK